MLPVADMVRKKPVGTLVVFALLCGGASFVPSPWWEGPVLEVVPELPEPSGAFVKAPEEARETVEREVAKVDLESAAAKSTEAPDEVEPGDARAVEPESSSSATKTDDAQPERQTGPEPVVVNHPAPADLRLYRKMAELADELEQPPGKLERPCRHWVPNWRAPGLRPVCAERPMDAFFSQLRDVAVRSADRPVRISQFGDSLVAGDTFTGEMRRLLHEQFGDGGYGYIHVGEASRHIDTRHLTTDRADAWTQKDVILDPQADVPFGFAGVAFEPAGSPMLGVYPHEEGSGRKYDRVGILSYRRRQYHRVRLSVGGNARVVDLSGPADQNVAEWIDVEAGAQRLRLDGFSRGSVWYGIVLERSGPGAVVDNLGLSKARAPRLKYADREQWQSQIRQRRPDLLSFAYGVNSAGQKRASSRWLADYAEDYANVLRRAREAGDNYSCLVVSLLTRAGMEEGDIEVYDSVRPLVKHQRRAARRAGCGFWNAFQAIGGAAGTKRWYDNRPQLLGSDFAHPTGAGYKKLANLFYGSLVEAFVRYLGERIRRDSIPRVRVDDAKSQFRAPRRQSRAGGG